MEKKQIIQPGKEYFKAPIDDKTSLIGLENSEQLLREGDKTIILDVAEQYNEERNSSNKYKIYGKLRMIFRNLYSGTTSYSNLNEYMYLIGDGSDGNFNGFLPYDEFAFIRRDTYKPEILIPTVDSSSTIGSYNPIFSLPTVPKNKHQELSNMVAPYHNWNVYLSYVYDDDSLYPIKYTLTGDTKVSFVSGDGIPCRIEDKTTYYKLTSPVQHGINESEYVLISGKTYSIFSLGDENYDSEKYVINLNKQQFSGSSLSGIVLIKRCIDNKNISGTTSNYYVHKHKTITTTADYVMDKIGFESPIFEEEKKILYENSAGVNDFIVERNRMESVLYDFKNSFTLSGITNNMGNTPSEIYVTVIFKNGSGYFEYPPKIGYPFHLHNTWLDEHFSGTTSNETTLTSSPYIRNSKTFYTGNTLPIGSELIGAFVEYNPIDLKERIICNAFHKLTNPTDIFDFNQTNPLYYTGASENNKLGLYYQPFYKVKLRELSAYIETSETDKIENLPDNARYFSNEKLWKWRDVYDHGYIDPDGNGTDFPFINGQHYVKNDINFYIRNEKEYTNKSNGLNPFKNNSDC